MIFERIVDFFAPALCIGCDYRGDVICKNCFATIIAVRQRCYLCGRENNGEVCDGCAGRSPLASLTVGGDYEGLLREAVLALKNNGARGAAWRLARLMDPSLRKLGAGVDLITWVPVSPTRRRERGYNQAELLGRALARQLGVPARAILGRTTSLHQTGASRAQRLAQVAGGFYSMRRVDGLKILLVDDVATTTATLEECARGLLEAGAAEVRAVVAARARG